MVTMGMMGVMGVMGEMVLDASVPPGPVALTQHEEPPQEFAGGSAQQVTQHGAWSVEHESSESE